MDEYDVVVVGAGPGGYVAAIRGAQLGLRVALVERDNVGGICLNWGCIPSKALIRNAEVLSLFQRASEFGVAFQNLTYDFGKAVDRSRRIVNRFVKGVEYLLRKNKVTLYHGEAFLEDEHTIAIKPDQESIKARNVIIATGARPKSIPALPVDERVVVTSREALAEREVPARVVIVGGGATGVEFAYVYNAYGVHVTLVEMLPHLLPNEDAEVSQELEKAFGKQGIVFKTNAKVVDFKKLDRKARVTIASKDGQEVVECQRVLVAVGVQGNVEGLGLEEVGVAVERGYIPINQRMQTSVPHIYAIGDVTGRMLLAHVASAQGVAAAETVAGVEARPLDYRKMPRATYCQPQVASFGLTEREAQEESRQVKVGRFPFIANGKALAFGETEGFAKVVVDADSGEVLGAHLVGSEVTELLGELSLANLLEGTSREVGWLVHLHPSLSEVVREAALAADGEAIHI